MGMAGDSAELQQEELCALEAIYGEDCKVDYENSAVEIIIPDRAARPNLKICVFMSQGYPKECPPIVELQASHLPDDLLHWCARQLETQFIPGEVVLYNWVEWLKEQWSSWEAAGGSGAAAPPDTDEVPEATARQVERPAPASTSPLAALMAGRIISGEPVTERKSTFQAHIAPVTSSAEVSAVMEVLLQSNKVRNATHNIMAYRIMVPEKSTVLQDYDDDGEAQAGGRLLHLLQVADVQNAVVVVSRWFGGVLLGPSRFTHINNTARQLLELHGYIPPQHCAGGGGNKSKQRK